jgi:alanine dehydrogenase
MIAAVGEMLYLSRADVERLLDLDAMLEALAAALVIFSSGTTSVPPRVAARVPDLGLLGAMAGYVPGVALETKLVSVFPANDHNGMPSHQGLIALFDEKDGTPLALMDGTYITAIRTGGTAAVAARALSREDASVLAILGAGVQGSSHLRTFPRVRELTEVRVASRNTTRAMALAADHPRARVVSSFEEAVRGADIVACCTDAREPILRRATRSPSTNPPATRWRTLRRRGSYTTGRVPKEPASPSPFEGSSRYQTSMSLEGTALMIRVFPTRLSGWLRPYRWTCPWMWTAGSSTL